MTRTVSRAFAAPLALAAILALGPSTFLSSCAADPAEQHHAKRSLYERLGGEAAIAAVVDEFVGRAAGDPKVNFTRQGTSMAWEASAKNVARLKSLLVQFIGMATGGPQKYQGRGMKEVHAGMRITDAEFDALAGDLQASLVHFKVPWAEQEELLAIVGTTRGEIVTGR